MNRESGRRGVDGNENTESEQLSSDDCPSCPLRNDWNGIHRLPRDFNEHIVRNSSLNRDEASGFSRPVQLYSIVGKLKFQMLWLKDLQLSCVGILHESPFLPRDHRTGPDTN